MELASSCETSSHRLCITRPGVPLPLPRPPMKKNIHVLPKNVSHQVSHHQCADPRIDPIGKPPSANPVHRTHAKDSHPKLASDRALTPSRTRISSPPAIAREERRACSNNLPRRNATATRARAMGQDYPLTGPSQGDNPLINPSSLPPPNEVLSPSIKLPIMNDLK